MSSTFPASRDFEFLALETGIYVEIDLIATDDGIADSAVFDLNVGL